MCLIYATLGEHDTAVQQFIAATRLDNYLAVASVPLPPSLLLCTPSHPYQFQLLPMWGLEFLAWPLRSFLQRLRGSLALFARESINVRNLNYGLLLEFANSDTCPVIILNLGLLSHYILPRFSLIRVSHVRPFSPPFFSLKKEPARSLFNLSWPNARRYGRVRGCHEAASDRGA